MISATYQVTGMTCEHCVHAVTGELGGLDGVSGVTVDLVPGGRVRGDGHQPGAAGRAGRRGRAGRGRRLPPRRDLTRVSRREIHFPERAVVHLPRTEGAIRR